MDQISSDLHGVGIKLNNANPIFFPYNSYDGSNVIILTWSANQVEDYTTQIV